MQSVNMRLSAGTRDRLQRVAAEDFGGASADETVSRLLEEHWLRTATEAMDRYRRDDPDGWANYLTDADALDAMSAVPLDPWGMTT